MLITDLTMPRMTGIELGQRALEVNPQLPVILITGFSGEVLPGQVRALGFHSLLDKPISLMTLAENVRGALDQRPTKAGK